MTRWQLFGAVILRKFPDCKPKPDIIATKVQQIFYNLEVANSKFSNHEIQHIKDIEMAQSENIDVIVNETAQDRLDKWINEKSKFTFAEPNERSTKFQYLFVKTKFGTDIKDQWILPQTTYDSKQDDNLLETARRALRESLNIVNGYRIISKIPSSVLSFKYPKKVAKLTNFDGAKIFYLKAHLDLPSQSVLDAVDSSKNLNINWFTRDEAIKEVDKLYLQGMSKGLLHEDRVDTNVVIAKAARYATERQSKQKALKQASQR